uniref:U6 small nuclear RNA (adenine-(43)-N(6))-methyltransferase n=1 Tax=Lygus hesperus TaxID=30085 RepID=A0A0A9XA45_LYGHE
MAMNRFMHPRNPYKSPPDFKSLAIEYPEFREKAIQNLSGHVRLDFRNQGSVWALTKSLLHRDFGLKVEIIPDRLVPTLPLRLNYLLWLEDLFNANPFVFKKISGIDIGTGALCIYPLLAWKHLSWRMLGTETDEHSCQCAQLNIEKNKLEDQVSVTLVSSDTYLIGAVKEDETYDFCMCNPPFHKENTAPKARNPDRHGPRNAPTGTKTEVSVTGGEEAFVTGIINDSAVLKEKIRIYSVMLGHKSSVAPMKQKAMAAGALQTASSVFCQGRTTRWGLAWTFDPRVEIASVKSPFEKEKKQQKASLPFTYDFLIDEGFTYDGLVQKLTQLLEKLEIKSVKEEDDEGIYVVGIVAPTNTWINSRKRRREEKRRLAMLQSQNQNGTEICSKAGADCESFDSAATSTTSTSTDTVSHSEPESSGQEETSKRKLEDSSEQNVTKKMKTESDCGESKAYLKALITILELDDAVKLEILYMDGTGGRDSCNQLLVYLKSHIKDVQ